MKISFKKSPFTILCVLIFSAAGAENGLFDFLQNNNNKAASVTC